MLTITFLHLYLALRFFKKLWFLLSVAIFRLLRLLWLILGVWTRLLRLISNLGRRLAHDGTLLRINKNVVLKQEYRSQHLIQLMVEHES